MLTAPTGVVEIPNDNIYLMEVAQETEFSLEDLIKEKFSSKPKAPQVVPKPKRPEFVNGVRVRAP